MEAMGEEGGLVMGRNSQRVAEVDWEKVRAAMAKALRSSDGYLSKEEMEVCRLAWKYWRNQYKEVRAEMKAEAEAEVNPLASKRRETKP